MYVVCHPKDLRNSFSGSANGNRIPPFGIPDRRRCSFRLCMLPKLYFRLLRWACPSMDRYIYIRYMQWYWDKSDLRMHIPSIMHRFHNLCHSRWHNHLSPDHLSPYRRTSMYLSRICLERTGVPCQVHIREHS